MLVSVPPSVSVKMPLSPANSMRLSQKGDCASTHFWLWEKITKTKEVLGLTPLSLLPRRVEVHQCSLPLQMAIWCSSCPCLQKSFALSCLFPTATTTHLSLWQTHWEGWQAQQGTNSHLQYLLEVGFFCITPILTTYTCDERAWQCFLAHVQEWQAACSCSTWPSEAEELLPPGDSDQKIKLIKHLLRVTTLSLVAFHKLAVIYCNGNKIRPSLDQEFLNNPNHSGSTPAMSLRKQLLRANQAFRNFPSTMISQRFP